MDNARLHRAVGVIAALIVGAGCGSTQVERVAGPAESARASSPTPRGDPASPEPGDAEACEQWTREVDRDKQGDDPEAPLAPDSPARRPLDPAIRGFRADPAEYLPGAEREKLKGLRPLLLPRWLPEELRGEGAEVTVAAPPAEAPGQGTFFLATFTQLPDGSHPNEVLDVGIGLRLDAADLRAPEPAVRIRGRAASLSHSTSEEMIRFLWDDRTEVTVETSRLDYRINCRELIAIARSVAPFEA